MIDLNSETLVTLTEAARLIPRRRAGKKVRPSCCYRWTTSGCKGVVLESVQIGGTRCTSGEALARFSRRLTQQANPQAEAVSTVARRRRAAGEKLAKYQFQPAVGSPNPPRPCVPTPQPDPEHLSVQGRLFEP
jgi:hypothetical protein